MMVYAAKRLVLVMVVLSMAIEILQLDHVPPGASDGRPEHGDVVSGGSTGGT